MNEFEKNNEQGLQEAPQETKVEVTEAVDEVTAQASIAEQTPDNIIKESGVAEAEFTSTENATQAEQINTDNAAQAEAIDEAGSDAAKEYKSKKAVFAKTLALGLTGAVVFGVSLGASLGVSYNASRNVFVKSAQPFSFTTTEESDTDGDGNITKTAVNITPSNDNVIDIINKVQDSIVNISIVTQSQGFFNQVYESEGAGSGIIYSQDDDKVYIVTNNHVVEDATSVSISITGDEQVKASLVGKDASSDLAVISVLKTDLKAAGINDVTVAEFGDSDSAEVGEYVVAIGNALGEGKTTTRGIISAKNKTINIDGKKMTMIQTDAAINPGNSGGALVNAAGQVIGINTAKYSSSSVEGTGFAIPTNTAKEVITQLVENGTVDKPYLGISAYTINDSFKQMYNLDIDGVFVTAVETDSAAEAAGLQRTDIITAIDGVSVTTIDELSAEIAKHKSGDKVTLQIVRNGYQQAQVVVTLQNMNSQF